MLKPLELSDPKSCLNKAAPDEMVFVLLARDAAAPAAIRAWINERLRAKKNKPDDPQIRGAELCLQAMKSYRMARGAA